MLRDVFYYGSKPNAHPREKHAIDLADARQHGPLGGRQAL